MLSFFLSFFLDSVGLVRREGNGEIFGGGASETAGIEAEIGFHTKDILLVFFLSSRSEV